MHRTSRLLSGFFLAATFAASSAQAANSINITSSSCSGVLSILQGEDARFACTGDYSFLGGSINWDSKISFFATGNLLFDNFNITAKNIYMRAGGSLTFGGTGTITAFENITLDGPLGVFGDNFDIQIPIPINPLPTPAPNLTPPSGTIIIGTTGCVSLLPCNRPVNPRAYPTIPPAGGTIVISGSSGIVTTGSGGSVGPISITSSVPEPSTYATLIAGLLLLAATLKKRKSGQSQR